MTEINDLAVERNGDVVVVGARDTGSSPRTTRGIVVRLLPNGRVDRTFGRAGETTLPLEGPFQAAFAVTTTSGGRIVAAGGNGYVGREGVYAPSFVVGLRADGGLDSAFAESGRLQLPRGFFEGQLESNGDGSVILAGGYPDYQLRRILPDGDFDPDFGEGGAVYVDRAGAAVGQPLFTPVEAIGQGADGSILIAGTTSYIDSNLTHHFGMAAIRYTAAGIRDGSYGARGTARAAFEGEAFAEALAVQASGRVLVAGHSGSSFAVACFDPKGRRERRFGRAGEMTLRVDGTSQVADVVAQGNGQFVLVGLSQSAKRTNAAYNQTALARVRIPSRR